MGNDVRSRATVFGSVTVEARRLPPGGSTTVGVQPNESSTVITVIDSGSLGFRAHDDSVTLDVPRAHAVRPDRPGALVASESCEFVSLTVPDEVLNGIEMRRGDMHELNVRSPLFRPFADFLKRASEVSRDTLTSFSSYYFERLLQEMAVALIVDTGRGRAVPRSQTHFSAAMSVIAAQLADPDLSPSLVARAIPMSLRQLQRHFRDHDTTVEREIRRARVEQAASYLRDPAYDLLSIGQIARSLGFANGSSLARAMSAENVPSPAKVRRASRSAGREDPAVSRTTPGRRVRRVTVPSETHP